MVIKKTVWVENREYPVLLSDEREALLAAKAAGRAFVGVVGSTGVSENARFPDGVGAPGRDLYFAPYVVERAEDADHGFLERVVRRFQGLPWIIARSSRLLIREFTLEDIPKVMPEETDGEADRVFYDPALLEAYIRHQYGFYGYGLWALERVGDGALLGKAGICGFREAGCFSGAGTGFGPDGCLELGYHLFTPYRGQGYAREACRLICAYAEEEYGLPLCAFVKKENPGSVRLLEDLGFRWARTFPDGRLYYVRMPGREGAAGLTDAP